MSRIVIISSHSDPSEGTMRCECYERTLMLAISLSEQAGSDFVDLEHLLLAVATEDDSREESLALSIIKSLRLGSFDALRRGELK